MSLYNLSPIGNGVQFLDVTGSPLIGGQLRSYVGGSSTPQQTYTGPTGSISNGTIIILGADGRTPNEIWIPSSVAIKFVLMDSLLNVLHTWDNIVGINDFTTSAAQSGEWLPTGLVPNYYSTTQFAVAGNQLQTFQVDRRIQAQVGAGLVYGTITSSTYSVATTVTLSMDAGMALDVGLVSVNVALLSGTHQSVPQPVGLATQATNATTAANLDGVISASSTATTQTPGDSSTKIATTAFVNSTALTLANNTTATTQAASDNSTKVATTAFVENSVVGGAGSSYVVMTIGVDRSSGTTYTNSTGRPILVLVTMSGVNGIDGYVAGVKICSANNSTNPNISFIVPNGATYKVVANNTISLWTELR